MGWRGVVAFTATIAACSGGHTEPPSALALEVPDVAAPTSVLGGGCPDQGDAAACPELGGEPAWVGCTRITTGTNITAVQSCTCFATETGGGAWACEVTDASPGVPEASGPMTGEPVPPRCEACKTASSDAAPDARDE